MAVNYHQTVERRKSIQVSCDDPSGILHIIFVSFVEGLSLIQFLAKILKYKTASFYLGDLEL